MWHAYRVELYPHFGQLCGIEDAFGNQLEFPSPRHSPDCERFAMIRNESEYQEAVRRLSAEKERLEAHKAHLQQKMGLSSAEAKRALDPLRSFQAQLEEEISVYERLRRGDIDPLLNLHGLGRSLVALRIARGISQRELAERLGVHESQVSRDERNDYHGITVDRAARVLEALKVEMKSSFELTSVPEATRDSRPRK
jgi:hypothetical protein